METGAPPHNVHETIDYAKKNLSNCLFELKNEVALELPPLVFWVWKADKQSIFAHKLRFC